MAATTSAEDLLKASPHISTGLKKLVIGGKDKHTLINAVATNEDHLAALSVPFPLPAQLGGGIGRQAFYDLDNDIGVFALSSFQGGLDEELMPAALTGLTEMKARGIKKLIVDVVSLFGGVLDWILVLSIWQSNNYGGSICLAHVRTSTFFAFIIC